MKSSPTSSRHSALVHEIHDNFDFEQNIFQDTGQDSTIQHNSGSVLVTSNNNSKIPSKRTSLNGQMLSLSPNGNIASYFSTNFDENGYVFDGVKIDIEDIDNTSVSNITTQSLKRCKNQVLKHYYNLLCFIGWRPFYKEYYYQTPWFIKVINFLYPIIIIALLFYAYIYDVLTCQAKLNVAYDTQNVVPYTLSPAFTRAPLSTKSINSDNLNATKQSNTIFNYMALDSIFSTTSNKNKDENLQVDFSKKREDQCGHVVTTYILPSLMHLISYIIGFIYFRINENEHLYALMEKVFLAVNQTLKTVSQDRVIRRLKIFIVFGVFWVIMAMSMNILSRIAFKSGLKIIFQPEWLSIVIEAIALIILNSVYLAVVINHATQCEMIVFYVNEVRTRLEEKSINLKDAMQQILDIRMAIGNLNSTVSKMTTLVALIFIEKFIIGLIILILNRVNEPIIWIYRVSFTISWFLILAFTLTQVARLNSKCSKFKQIALSARVYGYHASNRDELDSFLLFVSNAKLRAKLFGVSLKPSLILGTFIIISFIVIILFQTSVITSPDFII